MNQWIKTGRCWGGLTSRCAYCVVVVYPSTSSKWRSSVNIWLICLLFCVMMSSSPSSHQITSDHRDIFSSTRASETLNCDTIIKAVFRGTVVRRGHWVLWTLKSGCLSDLLCAASLNEWENYFALSCNIMLGTNHCRQDQIGLLAWQPVLCFLQSKNQLQSVKY